jgi:predicted dehydrogenase
MAFRCGIIGIGSFYSNAFARALRRLPQVELLAAAHLDQPDETLLLHTRQTREQFATAHNVRLYADPREMIAIEMLDLVMVCAPDRLKAAFACLAIETGCHVYVSKPFCTRHPDAVKVAETARRHGKVVSTLEPARYDGAIRQAHQRVVAGEIGDVLSVRAWVQHGQPAQRDRRDSVEAADSSGGTIYSLGVYAAGLANWFAGNDPVRAYAEAVNANSPWYPFPDQMKGTIRYRSGRLGSADIYFATPCRAPQWEVEVLGRSGLIRVNQTVYEGWVYRSAEPFVTPFYRNQNDVILEALRWFIEPLEKGEPVDLPVEEAVAIIAVCDAWRESAETGQAMPVSSESR